MLATLNIITNPFHPNLGKVQKPLARKVRVNTLVNKHKIDLSKPVICYYNGTALLRKEWGSTLVKNNDVVSFIYLPQGGGGGSSPLRMVLMIAVMAFAPQMGLAMAGGVAGTMASIYTAAIGFLGSALVNMLVPPPDLPKGQVASQLASASPTYSLSAQGNQARIGQAIPVLYGRMKVYPDFAAQPYVEYENNDQYLYQLFLITQGKAAIGSNDIFIEDSPISSFDAGDFQYELVQPGSKPTLFPTAVYNASEVNGQELTGTGAGASFGPFSVNPALTLVNKLSFDIAFPRGLYFVNDGGGYSSYSVSFTLYAREIDDVGNPIGSTITLGSYTVSGSTPTAIRKTYSFAVPEGRYSTTVVRTSIKDENGRYANDMVWAGAKGYSSEQIDYGDATLLVLKLKANNNISQQSSRKINVIAQRHLEIPSYNSTTGAYDFGTPTSTSSIAWAISDICRAAYGAGVTTARYDIAQLKELDELWTTRGDYLNCIFDSSQTFWEALTMACRAGRVRPYIQGGMIHFVRDSLQTLPTALFTSRNIVKGSFKITYLMPSDDSADCVDVEYFDETLWKQRVVRATLDGGTSAKPAKVKAFGITNRDHAHREGMYMAASNRYRRKEISFETELEGHIPSLGDLVAIQSDIPEWGQSGDVQSFGVGELVSNEPFEWTDGSTHYMVLRRRDGSGTAPIVVTQGATPSTLVYDQNKIDFDMYSGFEMERTHISFGRSGQVVQLARIMTTVPRGNTVQITAINEDVRVHAADGTPAPLDVHQWSISTPKVKPILTDFTIVQTGSGLTPSVSVSWQPTPGASKYVIQKSTDGENWETLSEVTLSSFSFVSNTGLLYVRIAAFGGVIGPYVMKSINVGAIAPPANVTVGSIGSNGQTFEVNWSAVVDCDGYYVEVLNAGAVKRAFKTVTTNFAYTLENAIADGGPWRAIQVKVSATKGVVSSVAPLVLNGANEAPSAPSLTLVQGVKSVSVTISKSSETDYAGTFLYAGDTAGFTPDSTNLIYEGVGTFFLHSTSVQKYYKAAHYDTYGKTGLNYSSAVLGVPATGFGVYIEYSINGVSGWHSAYATGDLYMRQKVDSDGTWSSAIRIVGADGATGQSALTLSLSNESHTIPTDSAGNNAVYTGSGTTIRLYEGATELSYDGAGATNGTWKVVATPTGIAVGSLTDSGTFLTVGQHSAMTADTATISYAITGKRADGTAISLTATQSFAKAKAGVDGASATAYWSVANTSAIQKSIAGAYTPTSASVSLYSATGTNAPVLYAGRFVIDVTTDGVNYTNSYTSAVNENTKAFTPPAGIKAVRVRSYLAGGVTTLLDEAIIPIVMDGATGPAGPAGANGTNGIAGDSARIAYTKTALTTLSATPTTITTSGSASFPANASWGADTVWGSAPPTLSAGESLYQSDGIYSVAANQTIWGKPYLSSLKVGSLSAINANMGSITAGNITLDNAGFIRGGRTDYATGTGFYLGYSGATYKFSIGNNNNGLRWDGTNLLINGTIDGALTLNNTGHVKGGQTAYDTGAGFFLGYENGAYKFSIGNPSGQYLKWDGNELTSNGLAKLGGIQVYETAGTFTFTVPAGITKVYVVMCIGGGGGAGGGAGTGAASSGGGGGAVKQWVLISGLTPGDSITVTVGAGGMGASTGTGQSGGTSSFGAYVTAAGGGPGVIASNVNQWYAGGSAGDPTTATSGIEVQIDGNANLLVRNEQGGGNVLYNGAAPIFKDGDYTRDTLPGVDAVGFGGGGSPACQAKGGNGKNGKVVVVW